MVIEKPLLNRSLYFSDVCLFGFEDFLYSDVRICILSTARIHNNGKALMKSCFELLEYNEIQ